MRSRATAAGGGVATSDRWTPTNDGGSTLTVPRARVGPSRRMHRPHPRQLPRMRGEAGRASLWHLPARARPAVHGHGLRIAADVPLVCSEPCSVTMDTLAVVRNRCAKFEHFGMLCEPKGSPFWALGSVLAGSEARGTCLIASGCSVAGLARTTCDSARACARARATRFQPERVGPTPRLLWASPCGRALAGRWRTIPAAARGCPGRSRAGGGASRRSNRSPEAARVLSESQSKRCRSFADGSPDVRAMRSPRDLARGGARAVVGALD